MIYLLKLENKNHVFTRIPIITHMKTSLYPERTRCLTCRKKFVDTVLNGTFCSYPCAGSPAPSGRVGDAPRNCKREINGKWDFKTRFKAETEIPEKLRNDPATNIYRCNYCLFLHVGHSRPVEFTPEKLNRTITDLETLGTVISRARLQKKMSIKDLALRTKVPMVRIKELEEGNKNMRMDVLFRVLYILRIQFILNER